MNMDALSTKKKKKKHALRPNNVLTWILTNSDLQVQAKIKSPLACLSVSQLALRWCENIKLKVIQ